MSKRIWLFFLALIAALTVSHAVSADDAMLEFGRIYTYMPDITAEIRNENDVTADDISAKLGGETLSISSVEKYDSGKHRTRIFLLIEATAGNKNFETMKKAALKLAEAKDDNTDIVLYTYDNDVNKVTDGTEDKNALEQKIKSLKKSGRKGRMYEAVCNIYQTYYKEECEYDRQYILLMTSDSDRQTGAMKENEAARTILDKSIPVNVLALNTAEENSLNNLAELSRKTGGLIKISSNKKLSDNIISLKQKTDNVYILKMCASNNVANNEKKFLSVTCKGADITEKIRLINSKSDDTKPEVTDVSGDKNQNTIIIAFSKNMLGAEHAYNYEIEDESGNKLKISSVEYNSGEKKAYLHFDKKLYSGKYTITFKGLTDDTQNRNALSADGEYEITSLTKPKSTAQKVITIAAIALSAVLLIVVVIVLVVRGRKKSKTQNVILSGEAAEKLGEKFGEKIRINQEQIEREVGDIYKNSIKKNTHPAGTKIGISGSDSRKITFLINMKNRVEQKVEVEFVSSIIVGRTSQCELSVDDSNMSRQHFAIEEQKGQLLISDLNSSNGTFVNGYRLQGRKILQNNDRILAGATEFVVKID